MPRAGEYTYFEKIGEEGRRHAINKPFSDDKTPRFFADLAVLFSLLPPPPARILECGCGTGWVSRFLARKGYEVTAQDCSPGAIALAEANPLFAGGDEPRFICSDFEQAGAGSDFDAVVFYAALHHATDVKQAMEAAYKALKTGGVLLAVEPGLGHARRSRAVREKYDVGDRDMPPRLIVREGRKAGFREWRVYPQAALVMTCVYGGTPEAGWLKKLWKIPGVRLMAFVASSLFFKRYDGTVWMRK